MNRTSLPLAGITVLDLSRVLAGPWGTQILSDLGAEVIKVEQPGMGDVTRSWGPPFHKPEVGDQTGESAYYLSCNRGKQSICIDLKQPQGIAVVKRLAEQADVLVENFPTGTAERLGIGAETMCALNPRLVYCSITGFGHSGPRKQLPGFDYIIQAMGGLMSVTGLPDDVPGGEPMRVGVPIADLMTGLYMVVAIQGALLERERTGRGKTIDLSLLDVQVSMLANQAMNCLVSGESPKRIGNTHPNIVPYQVFRTQNGHLVVGVGSDAQYREFCERIGRKELADDPRFAVNADRVRNRSELCGTLQALFETKETDAWMQVLEGSRIPFGPIQSVGEALNDPQVRSREMVRAVTHPYGEVKLVGSPIRYDGEPLPVEAAPPLQGQHTDVVLAKKLRMPDDEIQALREKGVVA